MRFAGVHIRLKQLCLVLCFSSFTYTACAEAIVLATSKSLPPYINQYTNSGPQLEIVRQSLEAAGHQLKEVVYTSNHRALKLLETGKVHGIINTPTNLTGLYRSEPVIYYQNRVISLAERQFELSHVNQLNDFHVTGFQNANNFLGPDFKKMTMNNRRYDEVTDQLSQISMLYMRRTDFIVMDQYIFNHLTRNHYRVVSARSAVKFHDILPVSPRHLTFKDPALRNDFNKGLAKLRQTGRYQELLEQLPDLRDE